MGNFNAILSQEDREIGSQVQEHDIRDFQNFIVDYHISELTVVGRSFTWTNGHTVELIKL